MSQKVRKKANIMFMSIHFINSDLHSRMRQLQHTDILGYMHSVQSLSNFFDYRCLYKVNESKISP